MHVVPGLLCRCDLCGAREEHPGREAQQHGARCVHGKPYPKPIPGQREGLPIAEHTVPLW